MDDDERNFRKYKAKKSFEFGESTEKPDVRKYEGLTEFDFGQSSQPFIIHSNFVESKKPEITNFRKYNGLKEFNFREKIPENKSIPKNVKSIKYPPPESREHSEREKTSPPTTDSPESPYGLLTNTETNDRIFSILVDAIQRRKPISAYYNGYFRILSPFILGTKNEEFQCLFYQFGGESSSGKIISNDKNNWRCMKLNLLKDIKILEEEIIFPEIISNNQSSCLDKVLYKFSIDDSKEVLIIDSQTRSKFIEKHKIFLDFIKYLYIDCNWSSDISDSEVNSILDKFRKFSHFKLNYKTEHFYSSIVKSMPFIFSNISKSKLKKILDLRTISGTRKLKFSSMFKYIIPYLNPKNFAKNNKKTISHIFSVDLRIKVARLIYSLVSQLGINIDNLELTKILKKELDYLEDKKIRFLLDNFNEIKDSLIELIVIVKEIFKNKIESKDFYVKTIVESLLQKKDVINESYPSLWRLISALIDDFNNNINDFSLKRHKAFLSDDLVSFNREHFKEIFPNASRSDIFGVLIFFKKKKLIYDLCNLRNIPQVCEECGCSLENLPSVEFHHIRGKEYSWDDVKKKPYNEILSLMCNENIIILCSNCHKIRHSKVFPIYSDIIKNDNNISDEEIDLIIRQREKKILSERLRSRRRDIRANQNFYYIIKNFFNLASVASNIPLTDKSYPFFLLHHRDPKKKTKLWQDIRVRPKNEIIDWIFSDDIVSITSNEHVLIHSSLFERYIDFIEPEFSSQLKSQICFLRANIMNFKHLKQQFLKSIKL